MIADGTPLCPAGHLPLKGGDRLSLRLLRKRGRLISPLEGEMSGRTEGGARERGPL
jgi:hypothetical protein